MTLSSITPLLITFNEENNLNRILDKLNWAEEIIVIDSGSTDRTIQILQNHSKVEIFHRPFDSFAQQCNFGLTKVRSEWVLSMDADYVLTEAFIKEMKSIIKSPVYDGYFTPFKYCVYGKALRADNTTPRQVLYRKSKANYVDIGHQHRVQVEGTSGTFKSYILHDDRKSLSRWLSSQDRYLMIEAKKLIHSPFKELDRIDKIRKLKVIAPFVMPLYCLFYNRSILDGWAGIFYTLQRTLVELLLSIRLIELSIFKEYKNTDELST